MKNKTLWMMALAAGAYWYFFLGGRYSELLGGRGFERGEGGEIIPR